ARIPVTLALLISSGSCGSSVPRSMSTTLGLVARTRERSMESICSAPSRKPDRMTRCSLPRRMTTFASWADQEFEPWPTVALWSMTSRGYYPRIRWTDASEIRKHYGQANEELRSDRGCRLYRAEAYAGYPRYRPPSRGRLRPQRLCWCHRQL